MHFKTRTRQQWWKTAAVIGILAALANLSGCLAVAAGAGAGVGYAVGKEQDDD